MNWRNTIVLTLLVSITGCKKDDASSACVSACEAAGEWRDNCDAGDVDCSETCDSLIEGQGGDACEDEQIDLFDCMAGLDYGSIECDPAAVEAAGYEECLSEGEAVADCAGREA